MQRLSTALKSVLPDATSLGGDSHFVDRARLEQTLRTLGSALHRSLIVRLGLALILVLLLALVAWQVSDQLAAIAAALAGAVVIIVGSAAALRQVTDELARVRMLLAIAPDLTREALTEVTRWVISSG
jgi:uncharacterized membrane protein YqjE